MNASSIYLGFDSREKLAWNVARHSIKRRAAKLTSVFALKLSTVRHFFNRPIERRDGRLWCPISQAPMATEFAISRFCVPFLQSDGWALYADCDILCIGDIEALFTLADPRYAVMVVKHQQEAANMDKVECWLECGCSGGWVRRMVAESSWMRCDKHSHLAYDKLFKVVRIGEAMKMDGQTQLYYARKNWSSVVLWNCAHPANRRLTYEALNEWPGRDLHAFRWLRDDEIGALPLEWNYLVGVSPKTEQTPKLLHYTLGGPWLPEWPGGELDNLWSEEYADYLKHESLKHES